MVCAMSTSSLELYASLIILELRSEFCLKGDDELEGDRGILATWKEPTPPWVFQHGTLVGGAFFQSHVLGDRVYVLTLCSCTFETVNYSIDDISIM